MKPCILLFGMPRSGTTWVGKLFDSHPDTLYRHEPDSVRQLSLPLFPEKEDAPRYRKELETFVTALPRMRSAKVVGKLPLFPKRYLSAAALGAYRTCVVVTKAAGRVAGDLPCLYRPTAEGFRDARPVWKSIESPGRLGACVAALPDIVAVHLMRHPCGYVASVLGGEAAHQFSGAQPSADAHWLLRRLLATASGKARGVSLDEIKQLSPEERLAWRWVLIEEKVLADVSACQRVLTVKYENVCADPMSATRRMFEFAGLAWSAQTERFVRSSTEATGTRYYSVFKSPRVSADRWRSQLAPSVQERILRIVRRSSLRRFYDDAEVRAAPASAREAA